MNPKDKLKEILQANTYCVVATVSPDGSPWISPVYFAFDEHYTIYWYSQLRANHSQYILKNNQVAITVFDSHDSEGNGVFIKAHAGEVAENELHDALVTYFGRQHTDDEVQRKKIINASQDFLHTSPLRMWKAVPEKLWLTNTIKQLNGKWLDEKIEVSI